MTAPDERARSAIDALLAAAGWSVQDFKAADLHAARGVALREFELNPGHGTADYLLYVDGRAAGIVEAKKQGATLTCQKSPLPSCLPGGGAYGWRTPEAEWPALQDAMIQSMLRLESALKEPIHRMSI